MANPYYVQPLGGFNLGGAVAGLGQQFGEDKRMREQEAQKQAQSKAMQDIFAQTQQGDYSRVPELLELNPQLFGMLRQEQQRTQAGLDAQQRQQSMQATNEFDAMLLNATPEQLPQLIEQAKANPLIDFDEEDAAMGLPQMKVGASLRLSANAPEYFKTLQEKSDDNLTPKQRDFNTYKKLKEESPEEAKAFGRATGFLEDSNKRLFKIVDGVKYFSDGTEEAVKTTDKIKSPDMRKPMSYDQAVGIVDKAKEGQLKNAGFALTLNDGLKNIDSMIAEGYDPMSAAWVNKYLSGTTIGNLAMSADDQKFVGSVEQMINAIARRETGAAITAFEKEDFFNRYMPVAGDKPERVKQKRDALERQFKSIRGQSGSVYEAVRTTQGFNDDPKENKIGTGATPSYQEGQTATGPNGEKIIFQGGKWVSQ